MQSTIGTLLTTAPTPVLDPATSPTHSTGTAFESIFARELQLDDGLEDMDPEKPAAFQDGEELLQSQVFPDAAPLDALDLHDTWFADLKTVIEEVPPLQAVAASDGSVLPQATAEQLADAAFELGRLADELSSALLQQQVGAAGLGSTRTSDTAALAEPQMAGRSAVAANLIDVGKLVDSLQHWAVTREPVTGGDPGVPVADPKVLREAIHRLNTLLATASLGGAVPGAVSPAATPMTGLSADTSALSGVSLNVVDGIDIIDRSSSLSNATSGNGSGRQTAGGTGMADLLRMLASPPATMTTLPAPLPGEIPLTDPAAASRALPEVAVLAALQPALVRSGMAVGGTAAGQPTIEQAVNDLPDTESLLDAGFELVDNSVARGRELASASAAASASDSLLRAAATSEARGGNAEVPVGSQAPAERPVVSEPQRSAVATGKLDVWLQQSQELPDHILQHVGRMHAQALRLHGSGITDLMQRLTLSLHPEDLGQVDVQMRSGEQLSLVFHAREGVTRDLLEQNIGRLRALFEDQGIALGDVSVGTGNTGDGQQDNAQASGSGQTTDPSLPTTNTATRAREVRGIPADRLIDIRA